MTIGKVYQLDNILYVLKSKGDVYRFTPLNAFGIEEAEVNIHGELVPKIVLIKDRLNEMTLQYPMDYNEWLKLPKTINAIKLIKQYIVDNDKSNQLELWK